MTLLPIHPLVPCSQARPGAQAPFCNLEWRIETLDGHLVHRTGYKVPKDTERLVRRCTRCRKECP